MFISLSTLHFTVLVLIKINIYICEISLNLNLFTMVNTDDFTKRLETILEYYAVSASGFADSIGVQRSALSHLMSGRNKPSLDLIMKIVEAYPEVDIYWLLNGRGNFPKEKESGNIKALSPAPEINEQPIDLFSFKESGNEDKVTESNNKEFNLPVPSSDIDKVIIFYKDGRFRHYRPQ